MKVSSSRSDLVDRSFRFALAVRSFVRKLPKNQINLQDSMQLVRSSGSIGANYIEAQEALSKKDFGMRVKICRKEAKESAYWLSLFSELPSSLEHEHGGLLDEAQQLTKIFSSIVEKVRT
jgi:four helix bundle protein